MLIELCVLAGWTRPGLSRGPGSAELVDRTIFCSLRCECESEGENEWMDGWGSIAVDGCAYGSESIESVSSPPPLEGRRGVLKLSTGTGAGAGAV